MRGLYKIPDDRFPGLEFKEDEPDRKEMDFITHPAINYAAKAMDLCLKYLRTR